MLKKMFGKLFSRKSRPSIAVKPAGETAVINMREKEASIYGRENIDLQRLYEAWAGKETWLLRSEAIPLLLGRDPQAKITDENYEKEFDDLWRHAETCVKKGLLRLNGSVEEAADKWEASPAVIYQWAAISRIELPEVLTRLMEFILSVVKKEFKEEAAVSDNAKNKSEIGQHNGLIPDREKILGASLAILANHYDECKNKKGRIKVEKIMDILNRKSGILFDQEDLDISPIAVKDIIDNWLNKLQ